MNEIATLRPMLPAAARAETEALPHNIEAEQQLLGAILTNNDVYDRIVVAGEGRAFLRPRPRSASSRSPPRASRRTRWPRRSR